jgi:PAS domain S-box-containing protein
MTLPLKALLVEDSEDDARLLLAQLHRDGWDVTHERVETSEAMAAAIIGRAWDLVIADYALPQFSALDALRMVRERGPDVPFILVSGAIGEEAAVQALKAGANDYLFKNNLSRLTSAIQRELREAGERRELRAVTEKLKVSEIRHRRLFETTQDGILILDARNARVLDVNQFMMDLLGYSREHFLEKELWEIGVFQDAQNCRTAMASLQIIGGIRYEDLPLRRWDGKHIAVEFVCNAYDEGERPVIQCNIRDISRRKLVEDDLHRMQELFKGVLDASLSGVLAFQAVRDPASGGKIIDFEFKLVNPAAARMLKRRTENLIGKKLLSVLPGNRDAGLFDQYVEVVTTGRPLETERYYNYDNLASWYRVAAVKVEDGFAVMFDDITDRKHTEETLRESEERFRLLVEGVQEYGIFLLDRVGNVVGWNAGAERMKGYKTHEVIGRHYSMFFASEDVASGHPVMELKETATMGKWEGYGWRVRADGTRFWANVVVTALRDADGGLRGFSELVRDVSDRKKSEEALRESEARLRAVVETAVDGIITIDDQGLILLFNPAASRIFGYSPQEVAGKDVSLLMPAPISEAFQGHLQEYLKTGIKKVIGIGREVTARRKDGTLFPMDLAVSETWLGEFRTFTGIVRDISGRRQVDNELAKAKEDAEAANRSKSEFLANMSHEIRTPMTAILGFANMVVNKEQDKAGRIECAQIIRRNALHLLELINEILDLSKIEALQMKMESVPSDLMVLLSEIISLMRPRAMEKGLEFEVVFDGPIPRQIRTDPMRLRQILVNLLGNAVKFTDTGKITLRISDEGAGTTAILPRIDVIDSGIGMSPEQLSRLFRPFTQADESVTRKFGGTGLGLTISARLAKLLGGDITVATKLGAGSTFTLKIDGGPSSGIELLQNLTESMLPKRLEGPAQSNVQIPGRILLVDDGRDNQRLLRMLLTDAGAEVTIAENGQAAVEVATAYTFDLILMDMQMPVMDGYAATAELRRKGLTVPIIALTANAMLDDRDRCMACGCSYYLSKPVKEETLLKTVREHLGNYLPIAPPGSRGKPVAVPLSPPATANGSGRIKSTLAGDPRIMKILPEFIEGLPARVRQMTDLLERTDQAALSEVVHHILGTCGGYGFESVYEPAFKAQEAITAGQSLETIRLEVNSLIEIIRRIDGYDESKTPAGARETAK